MKTKSSSGIIGQSSHSNLKGGPYDHEPDGQKRDGCCMIDMAGQIALFSELTESGGQMVLLCVPPSKK